MPVRLNLQCFPALVFLLWLSGCIFSENQSRWIISIYKDLSFYLYLFWKVCLSFRAAEKKVVSIINTRNYQVYNFKNLVISVGLIHDFFSPVQCWVYAGQGRSTYKTAYLCKALCRAHPHLVVKGLILPWIQPKQCRKSVPGKCLEFSK